MGYTSENYWQVTCGDDELNSPLTYQKIHEASLDHLQLSNQSVISGEKEIEFEKKESEFLSPKDLVGKSGIVLKILDEIQNQRTDFGPKTTGTVEYTDGIETVKKIMRFNQIMINHLIDVTKSKDSKKWIGAKVAIQIDTIKGNTTIVPKEN